MFYILAFLKLKFIIMMKKTTKFLAIIGALFAVTSMDVQAQKVCNLGLTMVSPTNGQQIPFTNPNDVSTQVMVKFNIKNNGTAAIVPTDTIYYISEFSGNLRFVTGQNIAANATVLIEPNFFISNAVTADETRDYCLRLFPQSNVYVGVSGTDTTWATVSYTDSDTSNDRGCANIIFKKQGTSPVFDLANTNEQLNFYPNPATADVNFALSLEKAENVIVSVKDITGREVLRNDFGKVQTGQAPFKINVANLNNGIYFIELNAGERKAVGKMNVRH